MNLKTTYKIIRSILVVAILVVAMLYIGLYVVLSVPGVQNSIKTKAEKELSLYLKSKVSIKRLYIMPFNELRLKDVEIKTPTGKPCIKISVIGAGIRLWDLISQKKVVVTYAEIVGLDGKIWKETDDSPLNIDFIIQAFASKDKNKPPAKFDLKLHSIVIRRSKLSYDLLWKKRKEDNLFDASHISITDLRADLSLPVLKNDDFKIDLRRLSFKENSGFAIDRLSLKAHITNKKAEVNNIQIVLPESEISISDISFEYSGFDKFSESIRNGNNLLSINCSRINPVDFKCFYPKLSEFEGRYTLAADLSGNFNDINIEKFSLERPYDNFYLILDGSISEIQNKEKLKIAASDISMNLPASFGKKVADIFAKGNEKVQRYILMSGNLLFNGTGEFENELKKGNLNAEIQCGIGNLKTGIEFGLEKGKETMAGIAESSDLDLAAILDSDILGKTAFRIEGEVSRYGSEYDFSVDCKTDYFEYKQHRIEGICINAIKSSNQISLSASVDDDLISANIEGDATIEDIDSKLSAIVSIRDFEPGLLGFLPKYSGYHIKSNANIDVRGNKIDNIEGTANITDFHFSKAGAESIDINKISLSATTGNLYKEYMLDSDFASGHLTGNFTFSNLAAMIKGMIGSALPACVTPDADYNKLRDNAHFDISVEPDEKLASFFKLPVRPYSEISIDGYIDGRQQRGVCNVSIPYILQGTSKLIRDNRINISGEFNKGINVQVYTTAPVKNDEASLSISSMAFNNIVMLDAGWKFINNKSADGKIETSINLTRKPGSASTDLLMDIYPSGFRLNGAEWDINRSSIVYLDKKIIVDDLQIRHGGQFVNIDGCVSTSDIDELEVNLAGIDLGYVFDVLNINYVAFGGIATGRVVASGLFSGSPRMFTRRFDVKDFSYNNAVLGDANIRSRWNNGDKKVEIAADILSKARRTTKVDGGIFVTRDSLSFEMDADHVNIAMLKPFMSAFTSDVGGEASGKVKLFGTFKDIDLTGRVFADSICMKVDYTNVYYHGTDSVIMSPGRIDIPEFKLYDNEGHSGLMRGVVKHDYFHNPEFEFKLTNVKDMLCYDTNADINPDWYGRVHASGSGQLRGRPGIVSLSLDMTTAPASDFTFVLSENQTAAEYNFLTFSDRSKEKTMMVSEEVELSEHVQLLKKVEIKAPEKPTLFTMDIRCSVTPDARMNLIMDPKAGDKITARGSGPLQISYNTDSDEMLIYGKYTLFEGFYNFSLQDLILRDFKIRQGSSISFNGDPLQGVLDITAAYRVNTNLSDLDKSFANDRELNRTNVPVDALLMVSGDMTHPEIKFDISLPTLTQDVTRKVKSIISTEDMMTRQILYLLALNRFYTPEYMGSSSNGTGELASVASTTLSSQLSSFMGRLTDKVSFAPTFRSDKGDFSDMEVDVALSSRLLDNRLLVNGNFGYRDRATSQTTFIGDFDIEYLLNRSGDLRLKAYNHFNDQNYYLRSSLTTQGIGLIYRKDFDNPFTFLRRKKRMDSEPEKQNGTLKNDDNK